ncbi:MAG: hypothetical protein DHS20C16_18650 [Phycisphaerae bacterium]|nr:MAG: hypothetical protein DHS20C16_18650 [Phycisphaerae bacterium]
MPSSKRDAEDVRAFCAEVFEDDGVNPNEDKRRDARRSQGRDRKLEQLCKQVEHALHIVFPSVQMPCDARIAGVEPAPNAGRLRVMVAVPPTCEHASAADAIDRHKGSLRTEVAHAISRRRAPELVFSIVVEEQDDFEVPNSNEESENV